MTSETEIEQLEQRYWRYRRVRDILTVPLAIGILFSLPLALAYRQDLEPYLVTVPLVLIVGFLYWQRRGIKWQNTTKGRIASFYEATFMGTRWVTPAAAEGVVIKVGTFGGELTLAFPSGITETYERSLLKPVDAPA